ncbi:MAG TPA: hypothetical protein DD381_11770 [Lentisphaeria bacterium]|nr:MAG: hypothetical protein A2X47_02665 [Lentisphaerae bacterium GWF2_38_69]HBM17003.1 hypothetical protein [Lentisphaeria bacterium]
MNHLELSGNSKIIAALIIGILFGFIIVKASLSERKTFINQIHFKDNSLAITYLVSITVGVPLFYFLHKFGLINLNPSNYKFWPIVIGAIISGLGVALCGHIPLTAIVSFGTGRIYSFLALVGMLLAFPAIKSIDSFIGNYITGRPDPANINLLAENSLFFNGHTIMLYFIPFVCLILALFLRLIQRASGNSSSYGDTKTQKKK